MQRLSNASGASLIPFVRHAVEPGSVVRTDSWGGYNTLQEHGYTHQKTNLSESSDPAHVVMPGVHRVTSLLKRWLLGTHQGAVTDKHLDYYLDEYTFRFNRRGSRARGLLFHRLLQQAVAVVPISYKERTTQGFGRPSLRPAKWIAPFPNSRPRTSAIDSSSVQS